ncbi:MAG: hypothetical protein IPN09_01640 [Bacteroidetes bacterium]|nr:hypothetical protein [Bacteroidota bacterium]
MKIQIPTPCHENWDEMIPNEKGNFCKVCNKTVIDFTNMSEQELIAYFENKKPGATCGRLRADQLTKEEVIPTNWVNSFHVFVDKKINFQPFKRVAFLFLGIAVFFVSCIKKREIMGKIRAVLAKPNGKNDSGKIITIDNKSSNLKMGKPAINASVGRIDTAN